MTSQALASQAPTTGAAVDTKSRIRDLLGQGLSATSVASHLGVTDSYISQLMKDDTFRAEVREIRIKALQKHSTIDQNYDTLEERLQHQLAKTLPLLTKPREIADVLSKVNAAKRRSVGAAAEDAQAATVVHISIPTKILKQHIAVQHNSVNQIVQAGDQGLTTIASGELGRMGASSSESVRKINHDIPRESKTQIPGKGTAISLSDLE
jgi:transcriptional regulator with XRE-family HTH domain